MKEQLLVIQEALAESNIKYEKLDESSLLVTVPGEKKLYTNVIFKVSDKTLSINAFVIRRPDQNTEKVYEWLLRHNANMYLLSYATNELGDIYLVGRLPIELVTKVELDRILEQFTSTATHLLIFFWNLALPMQFDENGLGASVEANLLRI